MISIKKDISLLWDDMNWQWRMKRHFQQFKDHKEIQDLFGQKVCTCGFLGKLGE